MSVLKATVGAGALLIEEDKVLLVQLNYGKIKGHWILPGGLVEDGEDPAQAAVRELLEETNQIGTAIKPHVIRYRKAPADVYWVFHVKRELEQIFSFPKEEILNVKFWSIKEALENEWVRPMTRFFIKETALAQDSRQVQIPTDFLATDSIYFF